MFVYDVSNGKSYGNLRRWISELVDAAGTLVSGSVHMCVMRRHRRMQAQVYGGIDALRELPNIVVANKADLGGMAQVCIRARVLACARAHVCERAHLRVWSAHRTLSKT